MVNLKEMLSKDYFVNYCSQIKIYFLLALILLIVGFVIGWAFNGVLKPYLDEIIQDMLNSSPSNVIDFQSLFFNNVKVNILIILGGILFSIFSVYNLILNGALMGYVVSMVPVVKAVLFMVPHGIFEIPAILLAGSTAFMITHVIVRCIRGIFSKKLTLKGEFSKSRNLIETIVVSIILVVILLVIAAFIEANITEGLGKFILSFIS